MSACFLGVISSAAYADPGFVPTKVDPDPPSRAAPPPKAEPEPSWDLDGLYVWLGPTGAASHTQDEWDSTFGAHAAVIRVRENELVGAVGATIGASRWTVRGGARLWLDGLIGTRIGRMVGITAGPILELPELKHPEVGASVGVWAFLGVVPFVRVGTVRELGGFVEIGIHIALPVFRARR